MQRVLFDRPEVLGLGRKYVAVEDGRIAYIGDERPAGSFARIICGRDRLLIPGLYNCHTHLPMTLFRGYGEDLPLDRWLNERIWPAEELLTDESVYNATLFTLAESLKNGIVSVSDMYFFFDDIGMAMAVIGGTAIRIAVVHLVLEYTSRHVGVPRENRIPFSLLLIWRNSGLALALVLLLFQDNKMAMAPASISMIFEQFYFMFMMWYYERIVPPSSEAIE